MPPPATGRFDSGIVTSGTVTTRPQWSPLEALEEDMTSGRRTRLRNSHEHALIVDEGQVACPRRGIIDLELCFLCSRFRGFQEGITERLVCGYESVLGIPDFSWGMDTTARSVGPRA